MCQSSRGHVNGYAPTSHSLDRAKHLLGDLGDGVGDDHPIPDALRTEVMRELLDEAHEYGA